MPIILSYVDSDPLIPVAFEQVIVSSTVMGVVIPPGISPKRLLLSIHSNSVRVRWDGGDPTPSLGHQLTAGSGPTNDVSSGFELIGYERITRFRMVRNATADAEVAYTIEI